MRKRRGKWKAKGAVEYAQVVLGFIPQAGLTWGSGMGSGTGSGAASLFQAPIHRSNSTQPDDPYVLLERPDMLLTSSVGLHSTSRLNLGLGDRGGNGQGGHGDEPNKSSGGELHFVSGGNGSCRNAKVGFES